MRLIDGDKLYAVLDNIANEFFEMKSEPQSTMGQTIQYVMGIVMDQPDIIQPPNDPLTIEQLREMDGEPVYLYFVDGGEWVLLRKLEGEIFITHSNTICSPVNLVFMCGGKIYRRKPEEGMR